MKTLSDLLAEIQSDARYQINLDWGEPREGHPEGSIQAHIFELMGNLERLKPLLTEEEYWKLCILVHTHDTFKPNANPRAPIADVSSHASLARRFLASYLDDEEMLNIVQYHDEPYALWRKRRSGGDPTVRLNRLLNTITDWDLYLAFLVVDGCTEGKSPEPLEWFLSEIRGRISSRVSPSWISIVRDPPAETGTAP